MIFLLRYRLGFNLLLLLFTLLVDRHTTTSISLFNKIVEDEYVVIMPVTTRSQSRLLTGSSTTPSIAISTGTRVFSNSNSTDTRVLSESIFSTPSSSSFPPSTDTTLPTSYIANVVQSSFFRVDHCCDLNQPSASSFQILKLDNFETPVQWNFEISNSPSTFNFNLKTSQFSTMEEACNEDVADQKISKDAMDLTQILTMLTHQITFLEYHYAR